MTKKYKYIELGEVDSKKYFGQLLEVFKYFIKNVLQEPLENFKDEDGYDPDWEEHEGEFPFCYAHEGNKYAFEIYNNAGILGHNPTLYTRTEDDDILTAMVYQFRNDYKLEEVKLETIFSFDLKTFEIKEIFHISHHNLTNIVRRTKDSVMNRILQEGWN